MRDKFLKAVGKFSKRIKNINFKKLFNKDYSVIRRIKVRNRLIISFISISIVPLILVGIFSFCCLKNSINSKIRDYSSQILNQVEKKYKQ